MDVEKTMQFILEMQAQHAVAIQKNEEHIGRLTERVDKLTERVDKLDAQVATVTDLLARLAQAEIRIVERMNELATSQVHTDRRLDALIDVVDKLVRRNGEGPKAP